MRSPSAAFRRGHRLLALAFLLSAPGISAQMVSGEAAPVPAPKVVNPPPKEAKIGFSKLVIRPRTSASITIADEGARVFILDRMRARGIAAVGSESLVFGQDRSDSADFLLGGTLRELECRSPWNSFAVLDCRARIDWEVMDVRAESVVYTHSSWAVVYGASSNNTKWIAEELLARSVDELAARALFRELLVKRESTPAESRFVAANFAACPDSGRALPKDAEKLLNAVVIVELENGHGSGFFVGPDPYIVTAAHVVDSGPITVRLRTGQRSSAVVVRVDEASDVALLRLTEPVTVPDCLPIAEEVPGIGTSAYAMGAPASTELGFSMTQGIVSGIRSFDGLSLIQTDASVSPGNSGGPLLDDRGRATGIISRKVVGRGLEGIAFGVPLRSFLSALNLSAGNPTSAFLAKEVFEPRRSEQAIVDPALPVPELDLEGAKAREKAQLESDRAEAKRELTPAYIPLMRWGGLPTFLAGLHVVALSALFGQGPMISMKDYEAARTANDVGWIMGGIGLTSFILSFPLAPSLPADFDVEKWRASKGRKASIAFDISPSYVQLGGEF